MTIQSKILEFLKKHFNSIELIPMFLLIVGLYIKDSQPDQANLLISISIITMAFFYFLWAFLPSEGAISIWAIIIPKALGIGLSIGLVGILFAYLGKGGDAIMLAIGVVTIVICLLWGSYESWRTSFSILGYRGYVRGVGVAVIGGWMLMNG